MTRFSDLTPEEQRTLARLTHVMDYIQDCWENIWEPMLPSTLRLLSEATPRVVDLVCPTFDTARRAFRGDVQFRMERRDDGWRFPTYSFVSFSTSAQVARSFAEDWATGDCDYEGGCEGFLLTGFDVESMAGALYPAQTVRWLKRSVNREAVEEYNRVRARMPRLSELPEARGFFSAVYEAPQESAWTDPAADPPFMEVVRATDEEELIFLNARFRAFTDEEKERGSSNSWERRAARRRT